MVERPDDARLLPGARRVLAELRDRFALVAFVSGRALRSLEKIVQLPGCAYSGNHGMELRLPGGEVEIPSTVRAHRSAVERFAATWPAARLDPAGIWLENKGVSLSFHFRSATDVDAARAMLDARVRTAAEHAGLRTGWGRRILEVLPPVDVTKGTAVHALLERSGITAAAYFGDDRTDIDAWRALRALAEEGRLAHVACIAAASSEMEPLVRREADAVVNGPPGVLALLLGLTGHGD